MTGNVIVHSVSSIVIYVYSKGGNALKLTGGTDAAGTGEK
jgi:hypothetical protein